MNLFEACFGFAQIVFAVSVGLWLRLGEGYPTVLAAVGSVVAFPVFGHAVFFIGEILAHTVDLIWPSQPVCRHNRCRCTDYRFVAYGGELVKLRCQCGDTYLTDGNTFLWEMSSNRYVCVAERGRWGQWHRVEDREPFNATEGRGSG